MKNFINNYVLYWLESVWQLSVDSGKKAFVDKFVFFAILTITGGTIYLLAAGKLSPLPAKAYTLLLLLFFSSTFTLWIWPVSYVKEKNRQYAKEYNEKRKRDDKMIKERDSRPKRY